MENKEETFEDKIIEERKKKVFKFFKENPSWIFYAILIALVILGVYIRYLPLADHNPNLPGVQPGLWDITTNDYTLGPDLDPFLFLRYARTMIENGSLSQIDSMRNVPLNFDTTTELQMVSYMIVITYKFLNIFGNYSINFAGAFMPVWLFALTILSFFFFVREIFLRKDEKETWIKANSISLIATFFMIVLPGFLSRTVAGIPEKESVAFFFMFLSFYLFLKSWKSEKIISSSILGVLAGISTALMGLTWGGVTYVYVTIGLAGFVGFILNKFDIQKVSSYGLWLVFSYGITLLFTNRFGIGRFLTSVDTGLSCLVFAITILHLLIWKTKIKNTLKIENLKIPKTIITLIIGLVLGLLLGLVFLGPHFFIEKASGLYNNLIKPVTGRWSTTVAENRQPYFNEWVSNFGNAVFWFFFIGSVFLFNKMLSKIKQRDSLILTLVYVIFFFGLVFSRYASHPALLDGEGFVSKLFYFGSALLLVGSFIYYYVKYHKSGDESFENIEFEYILIFALFVLTLFTARSAVRLIMVLVPIAPIFLSYLLVELGYKAKKTSTDLKVLWIILFIIVLIIILFSAFGIPFVKNSNGQSSSGYYQEIKGQAYGFVPYYYTLQWQKAMSWVRNNTPENSVFAHWWDYGYWVQSIGNRATVTDGGNIITWWNYLSGRFVLTGDNQKQALEFLWNHNATHLLIDSSDIGKYGAFSQIGSNENFDRFSQGPITLISRLKNARETKEGIIRSYNIPSGNAGQVQLIPIEEDLIFDQNGTISTFFKENTYLMNINVKIPSIENNSNNTGFKQPEATFYSNGRQISIPLRYMFYDHTLYDYRTGINATIYIIQKLDYNNQGSLSVDNFGAAIYISPRLMRGLLSQIYLLNNALGNFNNFKIAHVEQDFILQQIDPEGESLGEFTYFQGLRGPIKIWNITYNGDEKVNEEYLMRDPPAYITWEF